jgi:sulfite dehydrogenase (cytochrome) subunit B
MKPTIFAFGGAIVATAVLAYAADEASIQLKQAPGRDQVVGYCSTCHSLDYIQSNAPFQTRQAWEATVAKMIKAYGAQIPADDQPKVVEYLATQYGPAAK